MTRRLRQIGMGLVASLGLAQAACSANSFPLPHDEGDDELQTGAPLPVRESGPWTLSESARAAGEAQSGAYEHAGAWDGGDGCSGELLPGTRALGEYLVASFAGLDHFEGYACRPNTADESRLSMHGTGRALDLFVPLDRADADNGVGDPVGNWLVEHATEIGVQLIIWDRTKWNVSYAGRKDKAYGGPHPHHDHLHIELTTAGARRATPWFADTAPRPPAPLPSPGTDPMPAPGSDPAPTPTPDPGPAPMPPADPGPATGTVTPEAVLAALGRCVPMSGVDEFATDAGGASTIPLCVQGDVIWFGADLDIDCDGGRGSECRSDPYYQPETSGSTSSGSPLDASTLPFIVLPLSSNGFDYRAHGISIGQVAAVIFEGRMVYGIFGDAGPRGVVGEASYAMAEALGIASDPRSGGVDSGVTFVVFTGSGARVAHNESHAEAAALGEERARALIGR